MDIPITCKDCGSEFVFTERDQNFYRDQGYENPKRCKRCRLLKKQGGNRQERQPSEY